MIRTVEFRNFKALRHVKLDLERFTVLVGPNASGKTSVLEGMYYLTRSSDQTANPKHQLLQQRLQKAQPNEFLPKDLSSLWTRGAKDAIEIVLETSEYNCKMVLSPPDSSQDLRGGIPLDSGWRYHPFVSKPPNGQWEPQNVMPPLAVASFLRLDTKHLASPSFSQEAEPRVGSDGQGLPSALAYLLLNRRAEFDQLLELLRIVCPYVVGIRFARARHQQKGWGEELILDLQGCPTSPLAWLAMVHS